MFRFMIVLDDEFNHGGLEAVLKRFPNLRIRDFDHKVFVTGVTKYGVFCSILWQCQKFGEVKCELSRE